MIAKRLRNPHYSGLLQGNRYTALSWCLKSSYPDFCYFWTKKKHLHRYKCLIFNQ